MTAIDFLWAVPVFGLLIFIHELGHFAVAKAFGIKVHDFALGFGPVLASFTRGDTKYSWRLLPLGGFVRMAGMDEAEADDPRGFNMKPLHARALVIAAGPVMNFVLAALLFAGFLFFVGTQANIPLLGEMQQVCTTTRAERQVETACPAYQAGLRAGDRILSIDGVAVDNWNQIVDLVVGSEGRPLLIRYARGESRQEVSIQPLLSDGRWMLGIRPALVSEPFFRAIGQGSVMTVELSATWLKGVFGIITGQIEPEVMGPVGITVAIAEHAAGGWDRLIWITALLSINLGLVNLLPIPALDGSRLVFLGLEGIRGRRIDPQRENMVHFFGFLLLIGLMIVITYSDVFKR